MDTREPAKRTRHIASKVRTVIITVAFITLIILVMRWLSPGRADIYLHP